MKKTLLIVGIIFIFGCSDEEVPISLPETIRVKETVVVEVTKVVEKEKVIYLDATYNPEPTWTPTPTPVALPAWTPTAIPLSLPTWTPTPTPTPLPPGDLGYELVRYTVTVDITEVGQVITFGVPSNKSPIVDSNRNDNLLDEIKIINDAQNYSILKISQDSNNIAEITLLAITPTGTTNISLDFYTTKK